MVTRYLQNNRKQNTSAVAEWIASKWHQFNKLFSEIHVFHHNVDKLCYCYLKYKLCRTLISYFMVEQPRIHKMQESPDVYDHVTLLVCYISSTT